MPVEFTSHPDGLKRLDYVVCHRVADLPIPKQPARITACCKCGERIWLGVESPKKPPTICMQCIRAMITPEDHVNMFIGPSVSHSVFTGKVHASVRELLDLAAKSKDKT